MKNDPTIRKTSLLRIVGSVFIQCPAAVVLRYTSGCEISVFLGSACLEVIHKLCDEFYRAFYTECVMSFTEPSIPNVDALMVKS